MFVKNLTDITLQVNKYNKTLVLKPGVNCVGAEWKAEDIKVVYGPKYVAFITGDEDAKEVKVEVKEEVKEPVKEEIKEEAPKAEVKEEVKEVKKEAPKAKAKAKK